MAPPPFRWLPQEEARLIEMANAGMSNHRIAHELGRWRSTVERKRRALIEAGIIKVRTTRVLGNQHGTRSIRVKTVDRSCLKCQRTFESEGTHNRICNCCKETDSWKAGIISHSFAA